jgi:mRNA-degrading endonuclease YafQ of YafQ-DinJ toxin-antitoxin module
LPNPIRGAQFRRDVKIAQNRGKDLTKFREVILLLIDLSEPERIRIYSDRRLRAGQVSDQCPF